MNPLFRMSRVLGGSLVIVALVASIALYSLGMIVVAWHFFTWPLGVFGKIVSCGLGIGFFTFAIAFNKDLALQVLGLNASQKGEKECS